MSTMSTVSIVSTMSIVSTVSKLLWSLCSSSSGVGLQTQRLSFFCCCVRLFCKLSFYSFYFDFFLGGNFHFPIPIFPWLFFSFWFSFGGNGREAHWQNAWHTTLCPTCLLLILIYQKRVYCWYLSTICRWKCDNGDTCQRYGDDMALNM